MKKSIGLTTIITLFAFLAIIYTSCIKDRVKALCSDVVCQNGGSCDSGLCICPAGYSGTYCQQKLPILIVYKNNTYTTIAMTINGSIDSIPTTDSYSITGQYGDIVTCSASTSGQYGSTITWTLNDSFPPYGTRVVNLDVDTNYFFLKFYNDWVPLINNITINYLLPQQTRISVNIPDDGNTYNIGYFVALANSNVGWYSNYGGYYPIQINLPFTLNQSYTFK